jgi:hypothetical protein
MEVVVATLQARVREREGGWRGKKAYTCFNLQQKNPAQAKLERGTP